jgi:predicted PurR-regulated permease PerM
LTDALQDKPNLFTRQLMQNGLFLCGLLLLMLVGWCLQALQAEVILLTLLLWLAYALLPLVSSTERQLCAMPALLPVPAVFKRLVAVLFSFLTLLAGLTFALRVASPILQQQVSSFQQQLPHYLKQTQGVLQRWVLSPAAPLQTHRYWAYNDCLGLLPLQLERLASPTHSGLFITTPNFFSAEAFSLAEQGKRYERLRLKAEQKVSACWPNAHAQAKLLPEAALSAFTPFSTTTKKSSSLSSASPALPAWLPAVQGKLLNSLVAIGSNTIQTLLYTLAGFVMLFYMLMDGKQLLRYAHKNYVLQHWHSPVLRLAKLFHLRLLELVRGQWLLAMSTGFFFLLVFKLLGLPYASFLALIMGLCSMVPVVGWWLGLLPALLVSVVRAPEDVLLALIVTVLAFNWLKQRVLKPLVLKHHQDLHPVLCLSVFLICFELSGFWSLFIYPFALTGFCTWFTFSHTQQHKRLLNR